MKIKRRRATKEEEETLEVESVTGVVGRRRRRSGRQTSTSAGARWPTNDITSTPADWITSTWDRHTEPCAQVCSGCVCKNGVVTR